MLTKVFQAEGIIVGRSLDLNNAIKNTRNEVFHVVNEERMM